MTTRSDRIYIYLQRPDTGEWVTVGRWRHDPVARVGWFRYAPSYEAAGFAWSIDPVNLPFVPEIEQPATRYDGLHDVLRDAGPDAWGQALLRREHGLSVAAPRPRGSTPCSPASRTRSSRLPTRSMPGGAASSRPGRGRWSRRCATEPAWRTVH